MADKRFVLLLLLLVHLFKSAHLQATSSAEVLTGNNQAPPAPPPQALDPQQQPAQVGQLPLQPPENLPPPPPPSNGAGQPAAPLPAKSAGSSAESEAQDFENFRRSPYYVPPFDSRVLALPKMQVQFVRETMKDDHQFFRDILREAIEKRNKMAPSVQLMFKYTPKILTRMIRNRQGEYALPEHFSYSDDFMKMLISIMESVVRRSDTLKADRNYRKNSVDTNQLSRRMDEVLNFVARVVNTSPMAGYLRWNETVLFKDRIGESASMMEEVADMYAQFRAIGYETTTFVAKRIISILNMFARGLMPSLKDVA